MPSLKANQKWSQVDWMPVDHRNGLLNSSLFWSLVAQSVCESAFRLLAIWCLRIPRFESCIQQRKTTCFLSIRKLLACGKAPKLTTNISIYIHIYIYTPCLIIIIKSEVWTITHYLGSGHETMVCAVCLSIFLWYCTSLNLRAFTSVELDALCAVSNKNFDKEPSVLELNCKLWQIGLRIEKSNWITEFVKQLVFGVTNSKGVDVFVHNKRRNQLAWYLSVSSNMFKLWS